MRLPTWVNESATWVWKRKWPILIIASTSVFIAATPTIWPGGWGIGGGESVVKTTEKNLNDNTVTEIEVTTPDPGKSLWDGLSLVGVPLSLALLAAWFQSSRQEQAANEAKEEVLQLYLDRISELLVDKNLMGITAKGTAMKPEEKELLEAALDVIQARTLSILRQFEDDIERKSSVIRFLAEAEIISKLQLNLKEANFVGAHLDGAQLQGANLEGANLSRANLSKAHLEGANLSRANLKDANLEGVYFREANLDGAHFERANLDGAHLYQAHLKGAHLCQARLKGAHLKGIHLEWADLKGTHIENAHLEGAYLRGVHLQKANLKGAHLEGTHLEKAHLQKVNFSNISFDNKTIWPGKGEVAKARNIPERLKKQLGLLTISSPPKKTSTP